MSKFLAILFVISSPAMADGFVCHNPAEALSLKVYNQTNPANGTRNGAVMILSDDSVTEGNKTIARFVAGETLDNYSVHYTAQVDHRYNDSGRKGELIGGTKIGNLKTITFAARFSYLNPEAEGAALEGILILRKRDGGKIVINLDCARYLKN